MVNHPIKRGPEAGKYQYSHGDKRYLLAKGIKTGPYGGHFQNYDGDEKRYLLKAKSIKIKK
jgi:hypothetical protein